MAFIIIGGLEVRILYHGMLLVLCNTRLWFDIEEYSGLYINKRVRCVCIIIPWYYIGFVE